ncbi:S-methyl-5'-thioadenosine phosphorylase [Akkermansiaceae bacterium]|nr:S-methyl-5'-thioadenosine phosphorylase [Akkermansiaceae bacterium]MDB4294780.1 S-methyl-5'-thioadenosine phosphorylase [Akkermansiaceae bacterium]MDB4333262.1 S-methyl-5'-thioadenosine phosphorylase [Akkermansiaceae bacterium]MDB4377555.1 S-methyl-5'-thioadenosine phosphorylase [Akkermansiaceae bacterium]MDB4457812.1 S-methyl-5'-thioadenosine phosphorylase [Akkermansiaceae bacterium]
MTPAIGIIGGSGVSGFDGMENVERRKVTTPFGDPSDELIGGTYEGRQIWFLSRHGQGHTILPTEVNHRANFWALRSLGVRWVICATAVGSLKEEYAPRSIVLPDQYFDRTSQRAGNTFFGNGLVAHVDFGDPISAGMRAILLEAGRAEGAAIHDGGTYVCMDGPAFSTRAESHFYRHFDYDIIGMTNLPEAKLAREAEIALATLGMVTDYDSWRSEDESVTASSVVEHLVANAKMSQAVMKRAIALIPAEPDWPEHSSLDAAIFTPREHWSEEVVEKLRPILNGR